MKTTLYHGTDICFIPPFREGLTFFAFTYYYAYNHACVSTDLRPLVIRCELDLENVKIFDPRKSLHRKLLRSVLPNVMELELATIGKPAIKISRLFFLRQLSLFTNDVWTYLEHKEILRCIQGLGFEGHIGKEDNEETLCLYDTKKVQVLHYLEGMDWKEYTTKY